MFMLLRMPSSIERGRVRCDHRSPVAIFDTPIYDGAKTLPAPPQANSLFDANVPSVTLEAHACGTTTGGVAIPAACRATKDPAASKQGNNGQHSCRTEGTAPYEVRQRRKRGRIMIAMADR
jgi:outer membrane biosynthesis protein TonB